MSLASQVGLLATRSAQEVKTKLNRISWNGLATSATIKTARGLVDYASGSAAVAGDLVIQTKIPTTSTHAFALHIRGGTGTANQAVIDLDVTGQAVTGTFADQSAVTKGDSPISQVRLMRRISDGCVAVAITLTGGTWSRPRITVDGEFTFALIDDTALAGWSASIVTDFSPYDAIYNVALTKLEALPATVTQAEAEAGTLASTRLWTPQRISQAINAVLSTLDIGPQAGDIKASMRTADHGRWLLCNAREVARAGTYSALAAALFDGTNYRFGNGAGGIGGTMFNLPPAGKFLMSAGATDGSGVARALAEVGGFDQRVIAAANLPPHAHTMAHTHPVSRADAIGNSGTTVVRANAATVGDGNTGQPSTPSTGTGTGLTNDPLPTLPPYMAVNFFIRY